MILATLFTPGCYRLWLTVRSAPRPHARHYARTALSGQKLDQQAVYLVGGFELHPVPRPLESLVAPRPGDALGGVRHLSLGQRHVSGAPHAHRRALDRRQLTPVAEPGLRWQVGAVVVEARR